MQAALMFTAKSKLYTMEKEGETTVEILIGTKQGKRVKGLTKQWSKKLQQQKIQKHPAYAGC